MVLYALPEFGFVFYSQRVVIETRLQKVERFLSHALYGVLHNSILFLSFASLLAQCWWNCRMALLEASFFGDYQQHSLEKLLDLAFTHFKSWCRSNKICCSQAPFTVKMVSCQDHAFSFSIAVAFCWYVARC